MKELAIAIASALFNAVVGWFTKRADARKQAKINATVDSAESAGTAAVVRVQKDIETARDTTNEALVHAHADAAGPDGMQRVNQDVADAIARASTTD